MSIYVWTSKFKVCNHHLDYQNRCHHHVNVEIEEKGSLTHLEEDLITVTLYDSTPKLYLA